MFRLTYLKTNYKFLNTSYSKMNLGMNLSDISETYSSINICKLRQQLKIYYQRDSLCRKYFEKLLKNFESEYLKHILKVKVSLEKLIITIPIFTTDAVKKFFYYKKIKNR